MVIKNMVIKNMVIKDTASTNTSSTNTSSTNTRDKEFAKGKDYIAIWRRFADKDWELWRILPPTQALAVYRKALKHGKFQVSLQEVNSERFKRV